MGCTDSDQNEIYQEFNPKTGFNQEEFLSQMVPIIPDLVVQDGELGPESTCENMITQIEYPDQKNEIHEMFTRMGIPWLNGKHNFVLIKKFSQLECKVTYLTTNQSGQEAKHEGSYPAEVDGALIIYPRGTEIIN